MRGEYCLILYFDPGHDDSGDQKVSVSCVEDGVSQPNTRLQLGYGDNDNDDRVMSNHDDDDQAALT